MGRYRLKNFTPVPDELIEKYGGMAALVYGRIWRYTNGGLRKCTASVTRIAKDLGGLSRTTVHKHIQSLIEGGEIVDLTPDLRNVKHTFNITRQLSLSLSMDFEDSVQNLNSEDDLSVQNLDAQCKESGHKDRSKDTNKKKDKTRKSKSRKPDPLFNAIAEVCKADPKLNGSSIAKVRHMLDDAGYSAEDVLVFGRWWNTDEWRRERPPTVWKLLHQINHAQPQIRHDLDPNKMTEGERRLHADEIEAKAQAEDDEISRRREDARRRIDEAKAKTKLAKETEEATK